MTAYAYRITISPDHPTNPTDEDLTALATSISAHRSGGSRVYHTPFLGDGARLATHRRAWVVVNETLPWTSWTPEVRAAQQDLLGVPEGTPLHVLGFADTDLSSGLVSIVPYTGPVPTWDEEPAPETAPAPTTPASSEIISFNPNLHSTSDIQPGDWIGWGVDQNFWLRVSEVKEEVLGVEGRGWIIYADTQFNGPDPVAAEGQGPFIGPGYWDRFAVGQFTRGHRNRWIRKGQTAEPAPTTPTKSDVEIIAEELLAEAERRHWCGEYDEFVARVNERLSTPLPAREHEVSVRVMVDLRVTVPYGASLERKVDAARVAMPNYIVNPMPVTDDEW